MHKWSRVGDEIVVGAVVGTTNREYTNTFNCRCVTIAIAIVVATLGSVSARCAASSAVAKYKSNGTRGPAFLSPQSCRDARLSTTTNGNSWHCSLCLALAWSRLSLDQRQSGALSLWCHLPLAGVQTCKCCDSRTVCIQTGNGHRSAALLIVHLIPLSLPPGAAFDYWTENSDSNIWEHCGLFEGDIMLHRELLRNGLLNERQTWPDAAVPFYIDPQDFSE